MSAVASYTGPEDLEAPIALTAIAAAERELADLFGHCDRLHRANIQHNPHSCLLCFEQR
ncbi:hypothetical protein [Nocardioides marmoriginsengisoli]|uniref:hypothetical protein n=1 Tax=Nocardioides marmoriginsengisoli TaxID=661483 RepID=UPI001619B970|nr:hypothetical protein [Nocardioides marmoriginsengisoli]